MTSVELPPPSRTRAFQAAVGGELLGRLVHLHSDGITGSASVHDEENEFFPVAVNADDRMGRGFGEGIGRIGSDGDLPVGDNLPDAGDDLAGIVGRQLDERSDAKIWLRSLMTRLGNPRLDRSGGQERAVAHRPAADLGPVSLEVGQFVAHDPLIIRLQLKKIAVDGDRQPVAAAGRSD